ncbi:glycerate-2-kinase [Kutzneria viridogrisea]|uniref:Secreted protein n=2 Tax=Kutzneria TaxID=43356 RepID=W5WKC0_9PSEU|nr:hypothetical protein [Kutzneria albida]AHI01634.1 hypothetical protein KALB_8277 [Kutzneria albida DSM 43870]MBA8931597.1 glycerate-2-kinase [Kutzneria viridogrisea]
MRKLVLVLVAGLLTVLVAPQAMAAPGQVSSVIGRTPKDLIAMGDIKIDKTARTFAFKTAERFGDPLESVVAKWAASESEFQSAAAYITRHPVPFHVFRLHRDASNQVLATHYYYTAG